MTEASDRSGIAARDPDGDPTDRIVAFLRGIGLDVREGDVGAAPFLPGLRIAAGALVFDRERLTWPGDLLHEAGHLAVTPAAKRALLSDDVEDDAMGEFEATAWAYAATVAIGLDPAVLFHEGGYHGRSAALITTYSLGVYPGVQGLVAMGLAVAGDVARAQGLAPYPAMRRWLRE
jgi:hypothetical protein